MYFDNVGGDHLEAAIRALHTYGRVVACGSVSRYNDVEPSPGPRNMFMVVTKRLRIRVHHQRPLGPVPGVLRARDRVGQGGQAPAPRTVVEGIDNAPRAFLGLLRGENIGKMLVKVGPDE